MKLTRQLQRGKDPLELTEVEWADLTDELDHTYQKMCFLKTGLETTLTRLTELHRDLKRADQTIPALQVYDEMRFVGRMIATVDIMLLDEDVREPLHELFDT